MAYVPVSKDLSNKDQLGGRFLGAKTKPELVPVSRLVSVASGW